MVELVGVGPAEYGLGAGGGVQDQESANGLWVFYAKGPRQR
jgi:hypothetical protein